MTAPAPTRLLIVCPAGSAQLVNDTLRNVDPTNVGDVISARLVMPGGDLSAPTVGYWGSWAMEEATNQALRAAIRDAGWHPKPSNAEQTIYADGTPTSNGIATAPIAQAPAWGSGQRMWLFDGDRVEPETVLAQLGLAVPIHVL